jgi:hypothetical protein
MFKFLRPLSIQEAEELTGICGPVIAMSFLSGKLKSLRRRALLRWARAYHLRHRAKGL